MSDQDETIFKEQPSEDPNQEGVKNDQAVPFADLLGGIKNDRGEPKYKTPEDAFKALEHSQNFIPELQEENKKLRKQMDEMMAQMERFSNIEESVNRLTSQKPAVEDTPSPAIDENSIQQMLERTLIERESKAKQQANSTEVVKALQERFGDEAEKTFYAKGSELGLEVQELNRLAASSPQAVLQLFGLSAREGPKVSQHSFGRQEVNTAADRFTTKQDSFVKRSTREFSAGASTQDYIDELADASRMVEELHAQGMSVHDLSNPKNYFKNFK